MNIRLIHSLVVAVYMCLVGSPSHAAMPLVDVRVKPLRGEQGRVGKYLLVTTAQKTAMIPVGLSSDSFIDKLINKRAVCGVTLSMGCFLAGAAKLRQRLRGGNITTKITYEKENILCTI